MKRAIVLGGTSAHIALINELKSRGYYTILIDYYENPVAKPYADEHIRESSLDQDMVLEIAISKGAELVISACVDQANLVAAYVMEKIGRTPPYSYNTAFAITNKGDMKRVMLENNIPTARHTYIETGKAPDIANLSFPLIVKPADACGAAGVKKCETVEDFKKFFPAAVATSRNGRAVVEEYVAGVEVSAYCFISGCRAHLLATAERLSRIDGDNRVIKCFGTIMPSSIGAALEKEIESVATAISRAYDLDNIPLHIQAIVEGDRISIIEFAPRVGGGLSYLTIKNHTGFDMISASVDSWEGKSVEVGFNIKDDIQVIHLLYAQPGVFGHIEGCSPNNRDGVTDAIFEYKTTGMEIGDSTASASRAGAFIVSGKSCTEIRDKVSKAFSEISVIGQDGKDLTRRDMRLDAEIDLYEMRVQ